MTERRLVLLMMAFYAVIGGLLYADVIVNGIFIFDDFEYVVGNPLIQDISFFQDMTDPRHIGYLSFGINYALDGEDPYGYHLVNVIIHIMNACLVFSFVRLMLKIFSAFGAAPAVRAPGEAPLAEDSGSDDTEDAAVRHAPHASGAGGAERMPSAFDWHFAAAMFAGLLFLVHPLATQAVSYITQRFTSLTTLFYLLSVFLYLKARLVLEKEPKSSAAYLLYALSTVSCILGMKTKEIAFTIPFMIGILEFLLFRGSVFKRRRFIYLIPLFACLVVIPLSLFGPEYGLIGAGKGVDEVTRKDKLYDLYERSGYEYLLTQFRVIVTYLRLLFFPVNQLAVYDYRASKSFMDIEVILSLTLLLSIVSGAWYCWRKALKADREDAPEYKVMAIGILWFFVALSIESSVIPIKDIIFEHRAYLPGVGFITSFSIMIMSVVRKTWKGRREPLKVLAIMVMISFPMTAATYARNEIWTDEVMFWGDIVDKTGKAIGYNNRGNAYIKIGQLELALQDLNKTISFFPNVNDRMAWENSDFTPTNMSKTYMSRGNVYAALGDFERAKADFDMSKQVMFMY